MKVEIINFTRWADDMIADIASICHKSTPKDGMLKYLLEMRHLSVLEHAHVTFKVEGISRTCSHQLVRHRIGVSITQESQRYAKASDFIIPHSMVDHGEVQNFQYTCNKMYEDYERMIKRGIKKEDARFILPQASETSLYITFNYRSLLNFYEERGCYAAQWEIKQLADMIKQNVEMIVPILAEHMVPRCQVYKNLKCINKKCPLKRKVEIK